MALAAASSSWGVKTATVSPLEVFMGPIAALPAAMFLGIVVGILGNFWLFVYFLGVLVCMCPILRFRVLFMFLGFYSVSL